MGNSLCSRSTSCLKPTLLMVTENSRIFIETGKRSGVICCPLTAKEIKVIQKTWPVVKENWFQICIMTFEKWFDVYPELQIMFKSFPMHLNFEELKSHKSLHTHATKMQSTLDILLSQVGEEKKFVNLMIEYGRLHATFGADAKYATSLVKNLQYSICETIKCKAETEYAWDSLLTFLVDMLKLGMKIGKGRLTVSEVCDKT